MKDTLYVYWWKFLPDEFLGFCFHGNAEKYLNFNKRTFKYFFNTLISQNFRPTKAGENTWFTTNDLMRCNCHQDSGSQLIPVGHLGSAILDPPSSLLKHHYSKAECGKSWKHFPFWFKTLIMQWKKLLKSSLKSKKPTNL